MEARIKNLPTSKQFPEASVNEYAVQLERMDGLFYPFVQEKDLSLHSTSSVVDLRVEQSHKEQNDKNIGCKKTVS